MAKKKFKTNKEKYITYGIYALATGVVLYLLWKYILKDKTSQTEEFFTTPGSSGSTSGTTSAPVYTNSTVFSIKNASTKIDRVQWMQNAYNKYAKNRKLFGLKPDWVILQDDGKYGSKTESAMYQLNARKSVSWNEVKARTDYLQSQLTGNSTNFNWE